MINGIAEDVETSLVGEVDNITDRAGGGYYDDFSLQPMYGAGLVLGLSTYSYKTGSVDTEQEILAGNVPDKFTLKPLPTDELCLNGAKSIKTSDISCAYICAEVVQYWS